MNGRVQDPVLGRFVSADPYITEPGFTQNYNRYSYVYNNPFRFRDPSGFGADDCGESGSSDSQYSDTYESSDEDGSDGYKNGSSESGRGAAACSPERPDPGQTPTPETSSTEGPMEEVTVTGERQSQPNPDRQPPSRDPVPDPNRGSDLPINQNGGGTAGGEVVDKYADDTKASQELGEYPIRARTKYEEAADNVVSKFENLRLAQEALARGDLDGAKSYMKMARRDEWLSLTKTGTKIDIEDIPLDLYLLQRPSPPSEVPNVPVDIPMPIGPN